MSSFNSHGSNADLRPNTVWAGYAKPPLVFTKAPVSPANEPSDEDVAKRAYEKFIERGGAHGFDREDWAEAHRELATAMVER
jgi:hypothetical protein